MNNQELTWLFRREFGDKQPSIHDAYRLALKHIELMAMQLPFRWDGDKQTLLIDKRELLTKINGEIK
jgi:hypothetical protein